MSDVRVCFDVFRRTTSAKMPRKQQLLCVIAMPQCLILDLLGATQTAPFLWMTQQGGKGLDWARKNGSVEAHARWSNLVQFYVARRCDESDSVRARRDLSRGRDWAACAEADQALRISFEQPLQLFTWYAIVQLWCICGLIVLLFCLANRHSVNSIRSFRLVLHLSGEHKNEGRRRPKEKKTSAHPFVLFTLVLLLALRAASNRSEERRVGKECVSTCRSRLSPSL